jgi:hypothetical protein
MKRSQPFSIKENRRLVENQHKIDKVFHILRQRNGTKCYRRNPKRRAKVVAHYLRRYHIQGSSVESFWRSLGGCILLGKAL